MSFLEGARPLLALAVIVLCLAFLDIVADAVEVSWWLLSFAVQSVVCWARGHDWQIIRMSSHRAHLWHLSTLAGCDADCRRCGKVWRDFEFLNRMVDRAKEQAKRFVETHP